MHTVLLLQRGSLCLSAVVLELRGGGGWMETSFRAALYMLNSVQSVREQPLSTQPAHLCVLMSVLLRNVLDTAFFGAPSRREHASECTGMKHASKLSSVFQTSSTRIPGTVIPPPLVRGGQQTSAKLGTQQNTQIVMPPLVRGAQVFPSW